MLAKTNDPIMKKAVRIIYDMSEDTKLREIARLREKALHDQTSLLDGAKDEGRAEGRAEKENEIIAKMKAMGFSDETIRQILDKQA